VHDSSCCGSLAGQRWRIFSVQPQSRFEAALVGPLGSISVNKKIQIFESQSHHGKADLFAKGRSFQ